MNAQDLSAYIGDPVCLCPSSTVLDSDGLASTNFINSIPLAGWDGVLFLEICSTTDATDLHQFQIVLSTSIAASDAATSNATWTCSDALFTAGPHAAVGDIHMLDFRIGQKEMDTGFLHLKLPVATETGAATAMVIGIPYGGTRFYPSTNAFTIVVADDKNP
jgi:hypothetical protein